MKRSHCPICHYPLTTCVCKYLQTPLKNRTHILILQHPDEAGIAKNTVRLLQLQLSHVQVVTGESAEDFAHIKNAIDPLTTALLYPGEHALKIDMYHQQSNQIKMLVVLDGTWKKTNKILALNPWLSSLSRVSFETIPKNQYVIRKAEQAHSLSTLESVGLFLSHHEALDPTPLTTLLNGMILEQTKYMPDNVKARYDL